MQKYWSGTVTRNTVMRRAPDYLDLTKPNLAALDYTDAVNYRKEGNNEALSSDGPEPIFSNVARGPKAI